MKKQQQNNKVNMLHSYLPSLVSAQQAHGYQWVHLHSGVVAQCSCVELYYITERLVQVHGDGCRFQQVVSATMARCVPTCLLLMLVQYQRSGRYQPTTHYFGESSQRKPTSSDREQSSMPVMKNAESSSTRVHDVKANSVDVV